MVPSSAISIYRYTNYVFRKNLADISHEESTQLPAANVNTMNWVAGHIIVTRDDVLKILGLPEMSSEWKSIYGRGMTGYNAGSAIPLDELKARFDRTQEVIWDNISKREWVEETDDKLLSDLVWFGFHESYHIGQLGTLRTTIGKKGMIE